MNLSLSTQNGETSMSVPSEPPKILIVGGGMEYLRMFYDAGFVGATSVEDSDVICFTGGEDVSPDLYGEKPLPTTNFNPNRDKKEKEVFERAKDFGIPMVGICRGSQFLNVMSGGRMWQHVNGHGKSHPVLDTATGEIIPGMTSTHHQMMRPSEDAIILATACQSTYKEAQSITEKRPEPKQDDIEVVWYEKTKALCFQPHPEFSKGPCRDYFMSLVDDYILPVAQKNREI